MKIKTFALIGCLISLSSSLYAAINPRCLSGVYVGVGAAENFFSIDDQYTFDPNSVLDTHFYDRTKSFSFNEFTPNLTVGYAGTVNNVLLGLEFNANFIHKRQYQNESISSTNLFSLSNTYSLWARLGYQFLEPTLVYGLAGVARTELKRNADFTGPFVPLGLTPVNQSKDIWGPVLGVGVEQLLTDNWHVALEYSHIFYGRTNFPLTNSIFKFLGTIGDNKVNLNQDTVILKLIYAF